MVEPIGHVCPRCGDLHQTGQAEDAPAEVVPPRVTLHDVVEGIATLTLKPGDLLVVRHPRKLSQQHIDQIQAVLAPALPSGVKPLVLDEGMTVARITRENAEAARVDA